MCRGARELGGPRANWQAVRKRRSPTEPRLELVDPRQQSSILALELELEPGEQADCESEAGHDCFPVGHHCGNDKHCCLGYCDRDTHRCAILPGATLTLCGGCTSNDMCTDTSCICCFDPEHCSVYTGQYVKS
jgi:hypothetical protein